MVLSFHGDIGSSARAYVSTPGGVSIALPLAFVGPQAVEWVVME